MKIGVMGIFRNPVLYLASGIFLTLFAYLIEEPSMAVLASFQLAMAGVMFVFKNGKNYGAALRCLFVMTLAYSISAIFVPATSGHVDINEILLMLGVISLIYTAIFYYHFTRMRRAAREV